MFLLVTVDLHCLTTAYSTSAAETFSVTTSTRE